MSASLKVAPVNDVNEARVESERGVAPEARYVHAIGALRAWITVLVLGHHAVLAYHPYAPPVSKSLLAQPRWWGAFPVIDTARWTGFSTFVTANEMYFMALMFLLSGLFTWNGLKRKGAAGYLKDRVLRLGLPFAIAAGVIAPIAYYPAYLQTGGTGGWVGYWQVFTQPGVWASGPAWFLWVLLAFDVVLAAVHRVAPAAIGALAGAIGRTNRPALAFAMLAGASAVTFLPLELSVGGMTWWSWGPFFVQTSRVLHYFTYFVFGVAIGAWGIERTVFAPGGALAQRWKRWLNVAGFAFAAAVAAIIWAFTAHPLPMAVHVLADLLYTIASAAMSFAALALFLHFAKERSAVWAALAPCAYGMYLVHYPISSWLQYALLGAALPGLAKGLIVWGAAVAISWGIIATLRRIPAVARVL